MKRFELLFEGFIPHCQVSIAAIAVLAWGFQGIILQH